MRALLWSSVLAVACVGGSRTLAQQQPPSPAATPTSLASRLVGIDDAAERRAVLDQHRDLVGSPLARALVDEARRLIDATALDQARRAYEIAIELAESINDRVNLASALIGAGSVHGRQGDYRAAEKALTAGLSVARSLDDVVRIDAALHNLGVVQRLQGNYEEALDYYQRVIALADQTGRSRELGPTFNNVGIVHMLRGSYRDALEALRRSLALKEAAGDRAGLPSTLTNIGTVQVQQGHPELALDYYRRSLEIAETLGIMPQRAGTLNDIGHAHAMLNRHDLALEYYRRALALHEAAGRRAEAAATLHNVGGSHRAQGQLATTRQHLTRALAIREAINDRPGVAETLVALGDLALAEHEPSTALDLADRATRLASETGGRETFWQGRLLAARAHQALEDVVAADAAYREAIETIEALRIEVSSGERSRQRYFERKLEPYHRLVTLSIGRGRVEEALAIAERARARVLLEVVRDGPTARRALTPEERMRERAIEQQLADRRSILWAARATAGPGTPALAQAERELEAARLAHGEFRAALYAAHPDLRLQRGDTGAGSLADAAALIQDERTALVEFVVADEKTYAFVLSPSARAGATSGLRVDAFELPLTRDRLRQRVDDFRQRLERRDLDFQSAARELFEALLGQAAGLLRERTNLVIVPDGPLWELPFHALRPGWGGYLIEQAAISYAPSIGVLRELRARNGRRANAPSLRLLALGDPSPPAASGHQDRFPMPPLAPLPDAARQVRALARLYGADRSVALVGESATERALRDASAAATVLHFATHGLLDNSGPMYSFLQLAGDSAGEAGVDGRLEAWEIADLRLQVEAVIVAACDTALGRVGPGEGMIGLSWAFILAGSPRTVAGLWKVDAASTTSLMTTFHRHFRAGLMRDRQHPGAAASLRQAALALLRDDRYRHPFYWAGFIVMGDGE